MTSESKIKSLNELGEIYKKVKENTILAYHLEGLSLREISRRIGGATPPVIKKILDEIKKHDKDR